MNFMMKMRAVSLAVVLVGASYGTAQAANAPLVRAEQLNQVLQAKHAGWTAKNTPMSQMSKSEVQHMLGLRRDPNPGAQFVNVIGHTRSNLPTVLDWRNKDGVNWVSPILNQANCGSCVAFAAIGVMETMVNISSLLPNSHVRLSPEHLFACGGGGCSFGWMPGDAADFLQNTGAVDEDCMPYTSGATGEDASCSSACSDSQQRIYKISSYSTPSRSMSDVESVKEALQHGPLVTTVSVYTDFVAYAGGVYRHTTGDMLGGHAISIVGYDDNKQAFIVRNSWGPEWGDNGFGYVAYDDSSGVGDETWLYEMPSVTGAVSLEAPIDYTYVTGSLPVRAKSTYPGTDHLSVQVTKGGQSVASATCAGSCDQSINVASLADGRYEVQVTAFDSGNRALGASSRHLMYVANAKPSLNLTFQGKDVDLKQTLSGRVEFNISANSSTVPMSSIEFHYKGPDGVDHKKNVDIVLSSMSLGWRTNLTPNGNYEVWMIGHLKTNSFDQTVESAHMTVATQN